jgi:hypothetical protein
MGIIYVCKIRCFKVKNINAVDLTVISRKNKKWRRTLHKYYNASKDNIDQVIREYYHSPDSKRSHSVVRILIPQGTNVLAFGNSACDEYDILNHYYVKYFNIQGELIKTDLVTANDERNNFMLKVPETTHYINYEINPSPYSSRDHDYALGEICLNCGR